MLRIISHKTIKLKYKRLKTLDMKSPRIGIEFNTNYNQIVFIVEVVLYLKIDLCDQMVTNIIKIISNLNINL